MAALDTEVDNLYVTVAAKSMRPDLQIIARTRNESSEPKLLRAGADRVVNPQQLGGDRCTAWPARARRFVVSLVLRGNMPLALSDSTPL